MQIRVLSNPKRSRQSTDAKIPDCLGGSASSPMPKMRRYDLRRPVLVPSALSSIALLASIPANSPPTVTKPGHSVIFPGRLVTELWQEIIFPRPIVSILWQKVTFTSRKVILSGRLVAGRARLVIDCARSMADRGRLVTARRPFAALLAVEKANRPSAFEGRRAGRW